MANDYAPKLFLRQAENVLLKEYFTARGELGDIDWDGMAETDVDAVYAAWQALPEDKVEQVEQGFPGHLRPGLGGRYAGADR